MKTCISHLTAWNQHYFEYFQVKIWTIFCRPLKLWFEEGGKPLSHLRNVIFSDSNGSDVCILIIVIHTIPELYVLLRTTRLRVPNYFLFRPFLGYINMILKHTLKSNVIRWLSQTLQKDICTINSLINYT